MKQISSQLTVSFLLKLLFVVGILLPFQSVFAASFGPNEVIQLTNADRALSGLPALLMDDVLTQAAEAKLEYMARHQYFSHTAPDGTRPWSFFERSGYVYRHAGENLAIYFSDARDEESAWMQSKKHRENILSSKYSDIGVAVRDIDFGGKKATVTVQFFGMRLGHKAVVPTFSTVVDSVSTQTAESSMTSGDSAVRVNTTSAGRLVPVSRATLNMDARSSSGIFLSRQLPLWFISEETLRNPVSVWVLAFAMAVECLSVCVILRGLFWHRVGQRA